MRTIRHLIHTEVLRAVGFITLAFVLLFFFFDLVDELGDIQAYAARGYSLTYALLYVGLQIPKHIYELLPITTLIGTIYVMARLAESSEYTILRTSGLGPLLALRTLLVLGLGFVMLTFAFGDYVAPTANKAAKTLQARFAGDLTVGQTGAWLKDRQEGHSFSVNIGSLTPEGAVTQVRIFEFDDSSGRLVSTTHASRGTFTQDGWTLLDVERRSLAHVDEGQPSVGVEHLPEWHWATEISTAMVATALLSPDRMQTVDLFRYVQHLQANGQNAQRYEIEFWRKVFYPLSCLVMMVLALPFAYLHFRSGNITGYVFVGVLVGISFFLLNNVFGFIGNLREWRPWLAAAAPGIVYSILSLGAFGWLVVRQ